MRVPFFKVKQYIGVSRLLVTLVTDPSVFYEALERFHIII